MLISLLLLALAGLLAGYINALAGAGSLLTLPALIFSGLDASAANATNRVAVVLQNAAAVWTFSRRGMRPCKEVWLLCIPASLGSVAGAWIATLLPPAAIQIAIAVAMVVFLLLSLLPLSVKASPGDAALALCPGSVLGFAAIGLYAGFLQAGIGILILLYLARGYGIDMISGNVIKVVVVLLLTVAALATFALRGETIDALRGMTLALATTLGAHLGVRAQLLRGERFVRAAVVVAVLASVVKLLRDVGATRVW